MSERSVFDLVGMYVALLTDEEMKIFEEAIKARIAHRSYTGVGGWFGLAKVGLVPKSMASDDALLDALDRINFEEREFDQDIDDYV